MEQTIEQYREELKLEVSKLLASQILFSSQYKERRIQILIERLGAKKMSVQIEVEQIAVGDYSTDYGTVKAVVDLGESIQMTFWNDVEITQVKGSEMEMLQGGRFDRSPS